MVLLSGRGDENSANKIFSSRTSISLLANVFEQSIYFLVSPDVLSLVIWNNVEAFPEGFIDFLCEP